MVAASSTGAIVTAFPTGEAPARAARLRAALEDLIDEGGSWTGTQGDLAARMRVDVKTVSRAVADGRREGWLLTAGRAAVLTYVLLTRPLEARSTGRVPEFLHPELGTASDTPLSEAPAELRTVESGPRAGAVPPASSSSSTFRHPPSDTSPSDTHPGDASDTPVGGHDGGDGPQVQTAWSELLTLFDVEPDADMARRWAALGPVGRATALRKFRDCPPRKRPTAPDWMRSVLDTAELHDRAEQVAGIAIEPELAALVDEVRRGAHKGRGPLPSGATVGKGPRVASRVPDGTSSTAPTFAWRQALPWIVSALAVGIVLIGRKSR